MRSGRNELTHFTDPRELGGRYVIGDNDVALGAVNGIYADIRNGYPSGRRNFTIYPDLSGALAP